MPNNVKTYDESDDPKDHLKIFQAAAKVERWAMLTWCHMFNSTLTGSARKCIKDLVEIHHIKQRDGESTEDFVQRFKAESREVGHSTEECMHLKRQIKDLIKNGKPSHVIKELKQDSRKDQPKSSKEGRNIRKG
ncbi:hypothetical protein Tco_0420960 [Tanacetum coccineum]